MFGHRLDRLITVFRKKDGQPEMIITRDELAELYPEKRTKTDFEITRVTEYQLWLLKGTHKLYAVVPDEQTKQEMLTRMQQRKLRDTKASSYNRNQRQKRKNSVGSPTRKGPENEENSKNLEDFSPKFEGTG